MSNILSELGSELDDNRKDKGKRTKDKGTRIKENEIKEGWNIGILE
jgi:hypothetical protein